MGDMGDIFRAARTESQERRGRNLVNGIAALRDAGIDFVVLSESHVRVGAFDYWPSTGLFIERAAKRRGRGINNLLKTILAK